ncbi:heparan-alpha-glucosaminide N-acetyltransferase [Ensifer sp. MJa1]|uniref:heparan-alpha-glucosaminide N-acetyltransferase n=1 Tax=Ensifer sp. MJa1 TaxID=2919888 RepID=UPI00300A1F30
MPDNNLTSPSTQLSQSPGRLAFIDVARGVALLAMATYHFVWDLEFFGYVAAGTAGTGGWKIFARLIASSFLFLAGYSLVLGQLPKLRINAFLRRFGKIAGAAALITLGTYFAFPDTFIFFGILHAIAAASVIGLVFVRLPAVVALLAAAAAIAAPFYLRSPIFDAPWLWWVGLSETLPRSNDYVPLLPWLGPFLLGLAAAKLFHQRLVSALAHRPSTDQNGKLWTARFAFAGRHSLAIYLIHQPVLIGLVYLFSLISPPTLPDPKQAYRSNCVAACNQGNPTVPCEAFCGCTLDLLVEQNLFDALNRGESNVGTDERIARIAGQCTMNVQSGD